MPMKAGLNRKKNPWDEMLSKTYEHHFTNEEIRRKNQDAIVGRDDS